MPKKPATGPPASSKVSAHARLPRDACGGSGPAPQRPEKYVTAYSVSTHHACCFGTDVGPKRGGTQNDEEAEGGGHSASLGKINHQIWACLGCVFRILGKINDQFWVLDKKILKSRLGVYTYYIASAVIIGVLAAWIVMSQGVRFRAGGWRGCAPYNRGVRLTLRK